MNALGFALVAATTLTGLAMLLVYGTEKEPSYRTSRRAVEFVLFGGGLGALLLLAG